MNESTNIQIDNSAVPTFNEGKNQKSGINGIISNKNDLQVIDLSEDIIFILSFSGSLKVS